MCIHCYPDGFQYASVCHKTIAKCFTKRCKGNKIFFNDGSHVTIFAFLTLNTASSAHKEIFGAKFSSFERLRLTRSHTTRYAIIIFIT